MSPQFTLSLYPELGMNHMNRAGACRIGVQVYIDAHERVPEEDVQIFTSGEIYNMEQIQQSHPEALARLNQNQVLLFLYKQYGLTYLLQLIRGCISMVILDQRLEFDNHCTSAVDVEECLYVITDTLGVHPICYVTEPVREHTHYMFSTGATAPDSARFLKSGTVSKWTLSNKVHSHWCIRDLERPYLGYDSHSLTTPLTFPHKKECIERFQAKYASWLRRHCEQHPDAIIYLLEHTGEGDLMAWIEEAIREVTADARFGYFSELDEIGTLLVSSNHVVFTSWKWHQVETQIYTRARHRLDYDFLIKQERKRIQRQVMQECVGYSGAGKFILLCYDDL